jgi:hypothetical protein
VPALRPLGEFDHTRVVTRAVETRIRQDASETRAIRVGEHAQRLDGALALAAGRPRARDLRGEPVEPVIAERPLHTLKTISSPPV